MMNGEYIQEDYVGDDVRIRTRRVVDRNAAETYFVTTVERRGSMDNWSLDDRQVTHVRADAERKHEEVRVKQEQICERTREQELARQKEQDLQKERELAAQQEKERSEKEQARLERERQEKLDRHYDDLARDRSHDRYDRGSERFERGR